MGYVGIDLLVYGQCCDIVIGEMDVVGIGLQGIGYMVNEGCFVGVIGVDQCMYFIGVDVEIYFF